MSPNELVYVTSGYKVIALKKADGTQVWEMLLVSRFFKPGQPFITMMVDETGVYAHTISEIFRLDLLTGAIRWKAEIGKGNWSRLSQISSIGALSTSSSPAGPAASFAHRRERSSGDGGAAS